MAELLLKIGPGANYEDGDPIECFSDHRIRSCHAESICHPWRNAPNGDRYHAPGTHVQAFFEASYQFRFERTSKWTATRTEIATGDVIDVGPAQWSISVASQSAVTVEAGERIEQLRKQLRAERRMDFDGDDLLWLKASDGALCLLDVAMQAMPGQDVTLAIGPEVSLIVDGVSVPYSAQLLTATASDLPTFFRRRRQHRAPNGATKRPIFGRIGEEVWYSGRINRDSTTLDTIWAAIETHTSHREAQPQFRRWPAGVQELRSHLFVAVDDFDEATAAEYVSSEYDESDPDNPVMVRKRKYFVDLDSRLVLTSDQRQRMRDPSQSFDHRNHRSYRHTTILERKTGR